MQVIMIRVTATRQKVLSHPLHLNTLSALSNDDVSHIFAVNFSVNGLFDGFIG
jgi:hypothetical protein